MNQRKAGAVLNYLLIGLNTLVGLLYTPYMLRMLGQNEYGLYSLVSSIIAYLTLLDLGFGNAVIRYTAKYRAQGNKEKQYELFGMFIIIYSCIGVIAFIIGVLLYGNIDLIFDRTMTSYEITQAKIMILLLIVNLSITFPFSVFGSIISAHEEFIFLKIVAISRIILSTLVIVALLYVGYKAIALVVVQTVFNVTTLILNFIYCKFNLKIKIHFKKFDFSLLKEISIYSFWIFLNVIMDRVYWSTGQFVLGAVVGTTAVAVFSVGITLMHMYMSVSTGISGVLLPKITAMVADEKSDTEISNLFIRTGRLQFIVIGLFLSGIIVFGQTFINLWAGDGYHQSYPITLIFFVTLFVPLIQNVGITILQARNQMKFRSLLYIGIACVSLVLQIIWSKTWGPIGCALAIGLALLLGQGVVMNIYYHIKQKLDILKFWREIGSASIVPIIFTVVGVIILKYVPINNWLTLGCGIFIFLTLYLPSYWMFSTNNYEREIFINMARKFKRSNK